MSYQTPLRSSDLVCGLYYTLRNPNRTLIEKVYLPQVELQAWSTILSTTSRTTLTQAFINPSSTDCIKQVRYTFPLYEGVSVVGFVCQVGDRTIIGEVKEKEKAKKVFREAVSRGETAGLLEQLPAASDVFTTTIGNIPRGATVLVKITYIGELKHDAEVDGIRFTIPTSICPRYGDEPIELFDSTPNAHGSGIAITVDAEMSDCSSIQQIRSPSHPIAVNMGTTSLAPNAEPIMTKACATLSLDTAYLNTDFVLQVIAKNTGVPKAILETHPTIPNQKALMATLVPRFSLPPAKPEIVFVCDQSGSMAGRSNELAVQALKVFLRSLPVGVKFNICAFGSSHSFLWEKSQTYSQQTLDEAVRHVQMFKADYGGTEMLRPIKATIEQRYRDIPLEVMLLTDGEIWNQELLFTYLNREVIESKAPIRVFTLGVGNAVSHALIEGVARAGNGFSQVVADREKMDTKVVRMLKGALSPHVTDYTLEVKYSDGEKHITDEEDDFEIVEKAIDSLNVKLGASDEEDRKKKEPISLFDTTVDLDADELPPYDETGESRYAHLPEVPVPKTIQAPQTIPPLFAFNRTSVYLLLGPEAPNKLPTSVVLRGTSAQGPLKLEIPVHVLEAPGKTIHQLAAKKAIAELEQGRGWMSEAKDDSSLPLKKKFESLYGDMVEREAVRLGVQFQVGGKWCSFVAVESKEKGNLEAQEGRGEARIDHDEERARAMLAALEALEARRQDTASRRSVADTNSIVVGRQSLQIQAQSTTSLNPFGKLRFGNLFSRTNQSDPSAGAQATGSFGSGPPPLPPAAHSSSSSLARSSAFSSHIANHPFRDYNTPATLGERLASTQASRKDTFEEDDEDELEDELIQQSAPTMSLNLAVTEIDDSEPNERLRQAQARLAKLGAMQTEEMQLQNASIQRIIAKPDKIDDNIAMNKARLARIDGVRNVKDKEQTPVDPAAFAPTISLASAPSDVDKAVSEGIPTARHMASRRASKKKRSSPFGGLFGGSSSSANPVQGKNSPSTGGLFALGSKSSSYSPVPASTSSSNPLGMRPPSYTYSTPAAKPAPQSDDEVLDALIALQTFQGNWEWNDELITLVKIDKSKATQIAAVKKWKMSVIATGLAVAYCEQKLASFSGTWELVIEKAKAWLEDKVDEVVQEVGSCFL